CNVRRPVGIVLNRGYGRRNAYLVALEINCAQLTLMSTAAMPTGDIAGIAAATSAQLDLGQRLMRTVCSQLVVDHRGLKAQRRRHRSVSFDSHKNSAFTNSVHAPASFRRLSVL